MGFEECSSATGENIEKILTEVITSIFMKLMPHFRYLLNDV